MPITAQIYTVLYQQKDPKVAVNELMSRQKKAE
jgi:glycerol-3-phosphate dehydrogenase